MWSLGSEVWRLGLWVYSSGVSGFESLGSGLGFGCLEGFGVKGLGSRVKWRGWFVEGQGSLQLLGSEAPAFQSAGTGQVRGSIKRKIGQLLSSYP